MVRQTESIKKAQLQEENALLKKKLQQQQTQRADITQVSEEQYLQEGPLGGQEIAQNNSQGKRHIMMWK